MTTRRCFDQPGAPAAMFLVGAILVMAGCAARARAPQAAAVPAAKAAPAGVVLAYKAPAGQVWHYMDESEVREVTDVMGQETESRATSTGSYSFRGKGTKEKNLLLGVTIDGMTLTVASPRGEYAADMKAVNGRTFDMVLSPLGSEVDVSGAEAITYEYATGPRSVAAGFRIFFPDLPDKPVKIGDSWPSSLVIEEKTGATDVLIGVQSVNTLEGFETVDGLACARIASKHTGTVSGTGNQQGAEIVFSGTVTGSDLWYFAPQEGLYVRSDAEAVSEITITVSGPQTMTFPTTQTRKGTVRLVGR